ncbi:MAG: methyl-accepting chemotaxis protein [Desulforhabdus sp.]|jgi:methyl-accepting chemotaxis protein|nr:methyl-accepting chemotaxis protein [Desulforhabdus sp.]
MRSKTFSLGAKLVIGSVAILLVPLIVVSLFAVFKASSSLQDMAIQNAKGTAHDFAELTQSLLANEIRMVSGMSVNEMVTATAAAVKTQTQQGSQEQIQELERQLTAFMKKIGGDYEGIFVTDTNGLVYADGTGAAGRQKLDLSERDYFKNSEKGNASVGEVVLSKKTNNPITVIAVPIQSTSGAFLGCMGIAMKLAPLAKRIAEKKIGETGYPFIVDQRGLFIAHPNSEIILKGNVNQLKGMEQISERITRGESGAEGYVYEGIKKIAGFAPVPLTGWSVVATQNESEFMAPIHHIQYGILIIGVVFLLLGMTASFLFARSISRPIGRVVEGLQEGTDQVTAASGEVSSASQSLAEGTSQQAASLEETSSALEELASMTRQNADNAAQTNSLMADNAAMVDEANSVMSELTVSMSEISEASHEMQKIIKTIDEVAFQTNLLALNAAVEAARAGEAGAGFAVVADEVRNLAMRASEAAKNTADLIDGSVKKIGSGSELVEKTATALSGVTSGTSKMKELVAEIAAASSEQAQGIEQINRAVSEMDKVVQQNAANAEESASAAEELNAQSEHMRSFVTDLIALVGAQSSEGKQKIGGSPTSTRDRKRLTLNPFKQPGTAKEEKGHAPLLPQTTFSRQTDF